MKLTIFYLMMKKIIKYYTKLTGYCYIQYFMMEFEYLVQITMEHQHLVQITMEHQQLKSGNLLNHSLLSRILNNYEMYGIIRYEITIDEREIYDDKVYKNTTIENFKVITFLQELSDEMMNDDDMKEHIKDKICWHIEKQKRIYIL